MTGGRGEWAHYERFNAPGDLRDWFAQGPLSLAGVAVDAHALRAAGDLREAIQRVAFALLAREAPRTSMVTCDAYRARWTAAWPAEFPPPTMKTGTPAMAGASLIAGL